MKKQLLIAAVAATMTSVAMADISINGSSKMNYTNTDSATEASDTNLFSLETNLGIVGKNGDTAVTVNFQTKNAADNAGLDTQDAYLTSKIGDVAVKAGNWRGSHNLLEDGDATAVGKFEASATFGGVTIKYADQNNAAESITLSGSVSGVALSHKMTNNGAGVDTTDSSISGSVSGVTAAYRTISVDGANNDKESLQISGDVANMTVTYASVDMEGTGNTISMDGYLGDLEGVSEAQGFGISTSVAGNTVAVKSIDVNTNASGTGTDDQYTKVVVTRPLASGATFEATYTDKDAASGSTADSKTLDLELAVKF